METKQQTEKQVVTVLIASLHFKRDSEFGVVRETSYGETQLMGSPESAAAGSTVQLAERSRFLSEVPNGTMHGELWW